MNCFIKTRKGTHGTSLQCPPFKGDQKKLKCTFIKKRYKACDDNKKERKTNMKIMEFKEKYNDLINEIDNRISYNNARGSLGYSVDGELLEKLIDCLKDEYLTEEVESEE